MNRREAIKTLGAGGLTAVASSLAASHSDAEAAPPKRKPATDPSLPPAAGTHPRHDMRGYGIPTTRQQVAMLVYPDVTALELIGPHQIFSKMGNVDVHLVWKTRELVTTDLDVGLQPTITFAQCPDNLTVLFVPGGSSGASALMNDAEALTFLAHKAATAKVVTSVGNGSLILASAGLLRGYKAACHWTMRDFLTALGAKPVKARVVEDRNRITGAGGTAGLDLALRVVERLRNEKMAKALQLAFEYDPQPPYRAGTPESAPPQVTQMEWAMCVPLRDEMRDAVQQAQKRQKR